MNRDTCEHMIPYGIECNFCKRGVEKEVSFFLPIDQRDLSIAILLARISELSLEVLAAQTEMNGIYRDAERYRWLRGPDGGILLYRHCVAYLYGETLDATVDKEMEDARSTL